MQLYYLKYNKGVFVTMSKQLMQRFFTQNKVGGDIPSAPALAHFHIMMELNPEGSKEIHSMMNDIIFKDQAGREVSVSSEKAEIEAAVSVGEIIRFMRRKVDPINQPVLVTKAISFENEVVPEIMRMMRTSFNTGFIEIALRVLSVCSKPVSDEIISIYDDVRNPYAQGLLLVVLGFKADEDKIPWMITQCNDLKRRYPNESHYEGAYYGLIEMASRFYSNGKA